MEDEFFIFHTGNFLPFHFHSTLKIFHSIQNFSCICHSIHPYQGKFKSEATRNLYCTFATLSVLLKVVAHEGKQYGTMHLIPIRGIAMTNHKNSLSINTVYQP